MNSSAFLYKVLSVINFQNFINCAGILKYKYIDEQLLKFSWTVMLLSLNSLVSSTYFFYEFMIIKGSSKSAEQFANFK